MMKFSIKCILSLFIFLIIPGILNAQFFLSGQDAAGIKWKQINTENFQIIFPSEFQEQANKLATTLDYIYIHVYESIGHKPKKISIILHSRSSDSNGSTLWAPKRIELWTTPAQTSYAQDWLDQLAVHQLRRVVQIDEMGKGIFDIIGLVFGEQLVAGVTSIYPGWLFEGDAVNTETALTSTGRGREASFEMIMKAQVTGHKDLF
jgi:hypothetical protein